VGILVYDLWKLPSDGIVINLTPAPKLISTPQAVAVAATPVVAANDAALAHDLTESALSAAVLYLSLAKDSAQALGAVSEVYDEDILSFDGTDFTLIFDGSAAGLPANADVDAIHIVDADTLLMSFDKSVSIGSLKVDDSDIVKFEAISLGPDNTVGTFSLFFEGAAVGLRTNRANVDALTLLSDGTLLISTESRVKVAGSSRDIKAEAEDILAFTPAAPGDYSRGDWSLYFDGSNVGIRSGSEDIDGLAGGPEGEIYLTTSGKFSMKGLAGSGEDVFMYTPISSGNVMASNFSTTLFFDGREFGLARNDVDAISVP
jgi:hypothetical protein